jgi:guanosine-diphosphatase
MIDAGSTGSRIHVYRFNNCGPAPELEHEEFKMTEKRPEGSGLSSYKTDVDGAAKSLDPLLEVAMLTVPDEYKSCSPIAVKATAGLRLLGDEMSTKILDAVRTRLETAYPFPVVSREKGGVEIMSGADEGVYAWVTTNYLLGNIGSPAKTPTAAVFDLGGGSTQIVFEPTFTAPTAQLADGDHKYALAFGGRHFTLYQHSHLGYGLMAARTAIHHLVVDNMHAAHPGSTAWLDQPVPNPCLASNTTRSVSLDLGASHPLSHSHSSPLAVEMHGPPSDPPPNPAHCRALAERMLGTAAACALPPCSFNGVHQPPLAATVPPDAPLYLVSYFYDRTAPLGMPAAFSLHELFALTAQVCTGEAAWADLEAVSQGGDDGAAGVLAELRARPEWCLDLSYMGALLHAGYGMALGREVRVAKTVGGKELGWCLGASLPLLERGRGPGGGGWECRRRVGEVGDRS